jgi:aldose 1-epimerase
MIDPSFLLENSNLKVVILAYGATINSIIDKRLQRELVLGFDEKTDYEHSDKYFGCTIGRVANRISYGRFHLNQKEVQLPINNAPHHLHGGYIGFDRREFTCKMTGNTLECTYFSPDSEEGYPGNLQVTITYTLQDDRLIIKSRCLCDQDTLVNITNHTYFNLDADKKSITSHCLKMSADRVYPVDEFGCTFNQPFDVLNTPFDFTATKPIIECLDSNHPQILTAKGLDHHFEVSGEGLRQAACLSVEDCTLGVYTDKPGVHVYTGNYLNGDDIGFNHVPYQKQSGICFETQYVPNSINFDTTIAPIVKAGKIQEHLTVFEFQQMSKR